MTQLAVGSSFLYAWHLNCTFTAPLVAEGDGEPAPGASPRGLAVDPYPH